MCMWWKNVLNSKGWNYLTHLRQELKSIGASFVMQDSVKINVLFKSIKNVLNIRTMYYFHKISYTSSLWFYSLSYWPKATHNDSILYISHHCLLFEKWNLFENLIALLYLQSLKGLINKQNMISIIIQLRLIRCLEK